ncbi:hypothetical protein GCM10009681_38320 [Luedemannella helvata]|uniref:Uncharacterized protein n=1 Tax=Luedemannella helvata TaxID=349315 RepID=A0ABP4WY94_9ACTN
MQDLHRVDAVEHPVPAQVDLSHATGSQALQNLVCGELDAGRELGITVAARAVSAHGERPFTESVQDEPGVRSSPCEAGRARWVHAPPRSVVELSHRVYGFRVGAWGLGITDPIRSPAVGDHLGWNRDTP